MWVVTWPGSSLSDADRNPIPPPGEGDVVREIAGRFPAIPAQSVPGFASDPFHGEVREKLGRPRFRELLT
jgi:hypothetical protein